MYTLYRHITPSNKVYVGITCQKPAWRWNHGKGYCRKSQPYFARAIEKYGWDNIKHEILFEGLTEEKAKRFEIELIRFYKMLAMSYNMTNGGDGHRGTYDRSHIIVSEETRKKMSESHKGKNVGKKNPNYGKHETLWSYGRFGKMHPASKSVYQYDKQGRFIKKWLCLSDAERQLGVLVTNITAVCRGKKFTSGGFRWSYYFPYVFSEDEITRKENKRKLLSAKAKEGFESGRRKRMVGKDNPMSRENVLRRQFDAELREKQAERKDKKEVELRKIEAQKSNKQKSNK